MAQSDLCHLDTVRCLCQTEIVTGDSPPPSQRDLKGEIIDRRIGKVNG